MTPTDIASDVLALLHWDEGLRLRLMEAQADYIACGSPPIPITEEDYATTWKRRHGRPQTREKPASAGRLTTSQQQAEIEAAAVRLVEAKARHRTQRQWPSWMRWFERASPFQFWTCQVVGKDPGRVKHWSRRLAEREAVRLAIALQQPVYVMHTIALAMPRRAPEPEVELVDAHTGSREWFNHPQEVCHLSARERKDAMNRRPAFD